MLALVARMRLRVTSPLNRREPTGANDGVAVSVPASADDTVVPALPTPIALVGEENASAKMSRVDTAIAVTVFPPSVVRSALSPLATEIRQLCAVSVGAQRI